MCPSPVGTLAGLEVKSLLSLEGVWCRGSREGWACRRERSLLTLRAHTGGDSCRQHGFWSFLRMQQSLKKILYYNNNNINLSYFFLFFFHFFWGLGWERRGRKSVIRLLGPEQRELLCGWVRPPAALGGWATPLKGGRAAPFGENWLRSETFQGFLSRRIRSRGLPSEVTEKKGSEKTHTHKYTHKNYEIKYTPALSRMTWRYKITALHWNFISKSIHFTEQCREALLRDLLPSPAMNSYISFFENWSDINNKPCCCWVGKS